MHLVCLRPHNLVAQRTRKIPIEYVPDLLKTKLVQELSTSHKTVKAVPQDFWSLMP